MTTKTKAQNIIYKLPGILQGARDDIRLVENIFPIEILSEIVSNQKLDKIEEFYAHLRDCLSINLVEIMFFVELQL